MKTLKLPHQTNTAEGRVKVRFDGVERMVPFDTTTISVRGCHAHVWLGSDADDKDFVEACRRAMVDARDVVSFSYCPGEPTGFWASTTL